MFAVHGFDLQESSLIAFENSLIESIAENVSDKVAISVNGIPDASKV